MSYSTVNEEYFDVDVNDDPFSIEDETGHLNQNTIKLIISQLRLTCTELKVALRLQGTNFLLHLDQLKNKHEALHSEVKELKRLIADKNVSDVSQILNLSRENANNQLDTGDSDDIDNHFSSNVFQSPDRPQISTAAVTKDTVKTVQQKPEALTDSRQVNKDALSSDAVLEDVENDAEKSTDASKCTSHGDGGEKTCYALLASEALSQECVVQPSKLRTDVSNSLCELKCTEDISTQNVTATPGKTDDSTSKDNDTAQNVKTVQNFNTQINSRKVNNFSNIKILILNKLTDILGEQISIKQMIRISENKRNSIMNEDIGENSRIIQICLYDDKNYSVRIVNKNEIPKIKEMDNERFYKVVFKRETEIQLKRGKKTVESSNSKRNVNSSFLNKVISDHNSVVEEVSSVVNSDVEIGNPINHTITTFADIHVDQGISKLKRKCNESVDVQCKNKKAVHDNDDPTDNSSCVSSTSIFDNEIVKKTLNTSINNEDEIQLDNTNNVSNSKPVILSNQVVEGDYYIKKLLMDIQDSIITKDVSPPVTEKPGDNPKNLSVTDKISKVALLKPNEITGNGNNIEKNQLQKRKNSNLTVSENTQNYYNTIGHMSETKTNHNGIRYSNNSTQQSFESLMNQSSFDISDEDSRDDQQMNRSSSRISMKCLAKIPYTPRKRVNKKSIPKRNRIYVRTEKRQLKTLPSVTLREYHTWDIDDDEGEITFRNDDDDDEVRIIEVVNTPIVID